jgi:hypothetical protein
LRLESFAWVSLHEEQRHFALLKENLHKSKFRYHNQIEE